MARSGGTARLYGRSRRGQRVEDVGDRHHPRLQRDLGSRDAARVAAPVQLLVVAVRDLGHVAQVPRPRDLPQEAVRLLHVALDLQPLARRPGCPCGMRR